MIRVLPISSWDTDCGIAEFCLHLRNELNRPYYARPQVFVQTPNPAQLDPEVFLRDQAMGSFDVLWLNYHAALHARWTPEQVARLRRVGIPVVVTYHDTGVPNSAQCRALHARGTPFIIHEPADDLPGAIYLRQGIPEYRSALAYSGHADRPRVGTMGFPFPWKNYDLLCVAAELAGWQAVLLAPRSTPEDHARWRRLHPSVIIEPRFIPAEAVVTHLAGCDATAFLYTCCNTGTSGAIRQGIATRKPVIATTSCRQFRDLREDPVGRAAISWIDVVDPGQPERVAEALAAVPIGRLYPPMVRLARQDSWARVADRYAEIFTAAVGVQSHDTNPLPGAGEAKEMP